MSIGYTAGVLNGINRKDAVAAIEVWGEVVGRRRGKSVRPDVRVFDSLGELAVAVEAGSVDVVTLLSEELIALDMSETLVPSFTPLRGDTVEEHAVLLVRSDSGINTLAALRGKDSAVPTVPGELLAKHWLDHELRSAGLESHGSLLANMRYTTSSSKAILSVFFGANDLCIVPQKDFETAAELNPQLGYQLAVLSRSPGFSVSVVCIREGEWKGKSDLIEALWTLHTEPSGEQILMLAHTRELVPFNPLHLAGTRTIMDSGTE